MFNYNEKNFWENFKKENIAAIELLIEGKHDIAAVKLICSTLDSLAGFLTGRISPFNVRRSFEEFLKKYMPIFYKYDLGQELVFRKDRKPVKNAARILYFCYRNGLIHDGSIGFGIEIYRDPNYEILYKGFGIKIMQLNVLGFWEYFKKAIKDFEEDLMTNKDIYENFEKKYVDISQPLFDLVQTRTNESIEE